MGTYKIDLPHLVAEAERAARRLAEVSLTAPLVRTTPLIRSVLLENETGARRVYLKLETEQRGGSCKIRSAGNMVLANLDEIVKRGMVTASTGNNAIAHGVLCQYLRHERNVHVRGVAFLPELADHEKELHVEKCGLEVHFHGNDIVESEKEAQRYASKTGAIYHSPYNDEKAVAGQATIAREITEQLPAADFVFVTVGGGGLAAGISGYLRGVNYGARVVGCLPAASPTMAESIRAGRIVKIPQRPSISNSAGGIEEGSITFDYCLQFLERPLIRVSEDEIKRAMDYIYHDEDVRQKSTHRKVEGAGAIPVAALLQMREKVRGCVVVLCICGANIGPEFFKKCISNYSVPDLLRSRWLPEVSVAE
jgi:threonine dehydratase